MSIEAARSVIDRLPDAVILLTTDGTIVGGNRSLLRLVEPDVELIGRNISSILADFNGVAKYLRQCARLAEPLPGSLSVRSKEDPLLACRCDGSLLIPRSENSDPVILVRLTPKSVAVSRFLALNRKLDELGKEIVRRQRVEQELREHQEWLRVTLTSIGDGVIATDVGGCVTFMNQVACYLTGWSSEEAIGRPLREVFVIVNEYTRAPLENPVAHVIKLGKIVGLANHTLLIARGGTEYVIEDSAAPIRDGAGELIGVVLVFHDSTAKNRAEKSLVESEEKFRDLAENIPVLAWMADSNGNVSWYNSKCYEYVGIKAGKIEGRGWESSHDPMMLPEVMRRWKQSLTSGEPFEMVFPLRGADGNFRPFLTRVNPVKDVHGKVTRWFGTNTDITEQIELENALKDSDRRKDEFLAMLAHELRNPLYSVSNAIQLLRVPHIPLEEQEWAKDLIERQVKHLARLMDDLLDVSRITRGQVELRRESLDASEIINDAVNAIRVQADEKKQFLNVSFAPGTLWCNADTTRLEQILINLLANATRYTEAGGHIWLSAKHDEDQIVFKIKDDGIGIPSDKLPHVFELFVQGDRPIARSEGGLGIGLTIVKHLVELHGGTIEAKSEGPGKGSEFTVKIPAVSPPRLSGSTTQAPRTADQPTSVLIVDDNVDSVRALERLLKLRGHEIHTAHEGTDAIEKAVALKPNFILLDIGLPRLNGYEVAGNLRARGLRDTVIIAITGYGQEQDLLRSREAGCDFHLVKPVDYDALLTLLSRPKAAQRLD